MKLKAVNQNYNQQQWTFKNSLESLYIQIQQSISRMRHSDFRETSHISISLLKLSKGVTIVGNQSNYCCLNWFHHQCQLLCRGNRTTCVYIEGVNGIVNCENEQLWFLVIKGPWSFTISELRWISWVKGAIRDTMLVEVQYK